jgi:DNA-binding response OmpR family regulator
MVYVEAMQISDVRVLVVDDHPDVAELVADVIGALGCPCEVAHTYAAAAAVVAAFAPDVLIVDRYLQDGSGLLLARSLRSRVPYNPYVIVFSGTCDTADEFDVQLMKPASPSLLREAVLHAATNLPRSNTRT